MGVVEATPSAGEKLLADFFTVPGISVSAQINLITAKRIRSD